MNVPPLFPTRPVRVIGVAVAAMAVVSGCATQVSSGSTGGQGQGMEAVTIIANDDRPAAPAITGKDLEGKAVSVGDWAGKIVVINAWGSWCGPCRGEADDLATVARDTAGKGVQFVGIDTRDQSPKAPLAFVREHGITYPNLYDPSGSLLLSLPPDVINPQAIPSTVVIDRHGRIAARALQPMTAQQLHQVLDPLVQEAS